GGLIRNAFISDSGRLLASIDFRSQEIRVLAHVSKDKSLLALLGEDKDIHSMTAASMWNLGRPESARTTYEDFEYARGMTGLFQDNDGNLIDERFADQHVQSLFNNGKIGTTDLAGLRKDAELGIQYEKMRKMAKVVNFGIIYGMSKYKLSDTLDISVEEADQYINAYFTQYPGVRRWMEEQRNKMRAERFTSTMLGRKRRVHQEMMALEFWKVQRGFRQGINAVIQGSSADMTKLASIRLQPLLKEIGARIVLWVHDEIIFDVPEAIGSASLLQIADIMCNALPLECGMKSDIEVGTKWGQKMSLDDLEELQPAHPKLRLHDFV
ncbi:MAG: hypothetical protein J7559_00525, partial [Cohnella sp.]|nr:hypothetical protein [Cohnella sp.]